MPREFAVTDRSAALRLALVIFVVVAGGLGTESTAATPPPPPFHAEYDVVWKGINAGTSTLELARDPTNGWTYISRNVARGLFKLALPGEILQRSSFTLDNGQPRQIGRAHV